MPSRTPLRLGTRDSLLARAQSRTVIRALKAADPGLDVEPVLVDTHGDRDRAVPLSEVRDPGFFSEELDDALRSGRVDFCVHSLKDLPLEPRSGIRTAAIPPREDPRDVIVFRPGVLDLLRTGDALRIGSSSTRRGAMTAAFLADALPRVSDGPAQLAFAPLRGPVEQRLARIRLPRSDADALDGVILALAGLARLWGDRDGHAGIAPSLQGTRLMVLPLSACPTAPGQGALSVDCRADDTRVTTLLAAIDDAPTARRVAREIKLLLAQPEADRNGYGATSIYHESCGTMIFTRGRRGKREIGQLLWKEPPRPATARVWDGADWVGASDYRPLRTADIGAPPAVFLAHWRALVPGAALPPGCRVWVSGVDSWRRLARQGIWVEGCADNLGFDAVLPTLRSPVLRLPALGDWTVLTRVDAVATWSDSGIGRVLATYAMAAPEDETAPLRIREQVADATHFFWGSAAQYRALRDRLPAGSHHACGPGKTYQALHAAGVRICAPFRRGASGRHGSPEPAPFAATPAMRELTREIDVAPSSSSSSRCSSWRASRQREAIPGSADVYRDTPASPAGRRSRPTWRAGVSKFLLFGVPASTCRTRDIDWSFTAGADRGPQEALRQGRMAGRGRVPVLVDAAWPLRRAQ